MLKTNLMKATVLQSKFCNLMPMMIACGAATGAALYIIDQSIRFDDDRSCYMYRTPSVAGNRKTYTLSFWMKVGADVSQQIIGGSDANNRVVCGFTGARNFFIGSISGGVTEMNVSTSPQVFRDHGAWYHFVVAVDTTQSTATDRVKIWANGIATQITVTTQVAQNADSIMNSTHQHQIGRDSTPTYMDGYLADIHIVDGTALTASDFGKFDVNGNWVPIAFDSSAVTTYSGDLTLGGAAGTASTDNQVHGAASNAFSDTSETYSDTGAWVSSSTTAYLQFAFTTATVVNRYMVMPQDPGTRMPKDWTFEGRIGAGSWVTLDTVAGETSWTASTWNTYDFTNTTAYDDYRINITANNGSTELSIAEMELGLTAQGTHGTNGFHIDGALSGDLGNDVSGILGTNLTQYNDYTGTSDINSGDTGSDGVGIRFIPARSGRCTHVDLHVDDTAFSGVTVEIQTDSSNAPSGTAVDGDSTVTGLSSGTVEWKTVTFPNDGPDLVAGTTYWVVVKGGSWALSLYTTGNGTEGVYNTGTSSWMPTQGIGHNFYQTTANHFATSGLTSADQMLDSPTDDAANGVGNYCTWNPLHLHANMSLSDGNLDFDIDTGGTHGTTVGTVAVSSGKWYWEITVTTVGSSNFIGVAEPSFTLNTKYVGETTDSWGFWLNLGQKITNAVNTGYGSAVSNGDVVMVALDLDNGKIWFGQDGTWEASGDPVAGTNAAYTTLAGKTLRPAIGGQDATFDTTANFGQSAFAHTPPTDFKVLCTANLPIPAIADPSAHFQTSLYTGTGASGSTVIQTGSSTFQPDMIWLKNRDDGAKNHQVIDDLRGSNFNEQLHPNLPNATSGNAVVDSVEVDGFTLGSSVEGNDSGEAHVGYQWLAANNDGGASDSSGNITVMRSTNATAGFSIITGTGNSGSGAYFGHGLNTVDFGIFKNNTTSQTWYVYSKVRRAQVGESVLHLDTSAASSIQSTIFGEPSSTQFYLDGGGVNSGTDNWLGLLWEAIPGFSAFGPYTGNGSADGPFIYTGFKSRWLLIKRTDSTGSWFLYDTVRNTFNPVDLGLFADASVAEAVQSNGQVDILSNGFKIKGSGTAINASGGTYIYAAFAEAVNIPGVSQARAQ